MRLVITEKNDAAHQIARLLCDVGSPKSDKVYRTPVYRFTHEGDEWVTIGLRGHIMVPDFPKTLRFDSVEGWYGEADDGKHLSADIPDNLARPPYPTKRKPFLADGIDIKSWKVPSLPYLVWAPIQKLPVEKDIIRSLKNLARKADAIVIGTDFDREGELIGSDALREVRAVAPTVPVSRARYSAFTKAEIDHAFEHLVPLDQDLADAGESRQYIDLIWGAVLTRYLTMARYGGFGSVRSAGRVQTPTLALVVERERARQAFKPKDYWVIWGMAYRQGDAPDDAFRISHPGCGTKKDGRIWVEDEATAIMEHVRDAHSATVISVDKKRRTVRPPAPFNTTSLQAAAAAEGIAPARTMRLAESLYMEGLISYPRVDNTVYPNSLDLRAVVKALVEVPNFRSAATGLLARQKLTPTRGKQQTTDHPPIYPTAAADPNKLQAGAWKLYNLIARRFMATLSDAAVFEDAKVELDVAGETFRASGNVLVTAGWRGVYPFGLRRDEQLPALAPGDVVNVSDITCDHKQTEPPARYSQGKLIQEMEKRGLGTKSTRASIIQRLFDVKYLKGDPCEPSQLGMAVIDALAHYAPHITTPDMTSELEVDMTKVSEGNQTQYQVVMHSRALLSSMMDGLLEHKDDLGEAIADAVTADAKVGQCPKCGRDLVMKYSPKTRASFIGCLGWPECAVTYPVPNGRIEPIEGEAGICGSCGAPRVKVHPFRQRVYETCVNPACPTNAEPDIVVGHCAVCAKEGRQGDLVAHKSDRTGRRFIRCTNYDLCNTSYPLPQRGRIEATGETCPTCGAPMVIINTQRGPWKICVNMKCPDKEKKDSVGSTTKGTKSKAPKTVSNTRRANKGKASAKKE